MAENNNENSVSLDDCDYIVTMDDAVGIAKNFTKDESVKVLSCELRPYSNFVLGLLGTHRSLKITIQGEEENKTRVLPLFFKSMPRGSKDVTEFINDYGVFVKETTFFRDIVPVLTANYDGEAWTASSFLIKDDLIVTEDIRYKGYTMMGRFYNDYTALKSILGTIARFHACSIAAEYQLNKNSQNPTTLLEQFPGAFREVPFSKKGKCWKWVITNANVAAEITQNIGRNPQKIRAAFDEVYRIIEPSVTHRNVICHGDLWSNNIMCDKSILPLYKCILVDFQTYRYAPLMLDILQLLHINSSRAFREKCEKKLVEHYHLTLEETVRRLEPSRDLHVPALHEILAGMKEFKIFGAVIACSYLLLGPKVALECAKVEDGRKKFTDGNVTDVIMPFMEKDKTFKDELLDAIKELADLSESL